MAVHKMAAKKKWKVCEKNYLLGKNKSQMLVKKKLNKKYIFKATLKTLKNFLKLHFLFVFSHLILKLKRCKWFFYPFPSKSISFFFGRFCFGHIIIHFFCWLGKFAFLDNGPTAWFFLIWVFILVIFCFLSTCLRASGQVGQSSAPPAGAQKMF